jgi:hypothetical protein
MGCNIVGISGQKNQKKVIEQSEYQNSKNNMIKKNFKNKNKDNPIFKYKYSILFVYKKILPSKLYDSILNKLIKITDF